MHCSENFANFLDCASRKLQRVISADFNWTVYVRALKFSLPTEDENWNAVTPTVQLQLVISNF